MSIFSKLKEILYVKRCGALALIDPDIKNDGTLAEIVEKINQSGFDAILVGGSLILDNNFDNRIDFIKKNTKLPVIIFPGSSKQLSGKADAILFLSRSSIIWRSGVDLPMLSSCQILVNFLFTF